MVSGCISLCNCTDNSIMHNNVHVNVVLGSSTVGSEKTDEGISV